MFPKKKGGLFKPFREYEDFLSVPFAALRREFGFRGLAGTKPAEGNAPSYLAIYLPDFFPDDKLGYVGLGAAGVVIVSPLARPEIVGDVVAASPAGTQISSQNIA